MRRSLHYALAALLLIVGCDGDDPLPSEGEVHSIPLDLGRASTYAWSFVELDSSGDSVLIDQGTFLVKVVSVNERIGTYVDLVRLDAFPVAAETVRASVWYRQTAEELIEVAYSGAGRVPIVMPKTEGRDRGRSNRGSGPSVYAEPRIVQMLMTRAGLDLDSVIVRDDPRVVYRYPLAPGQAWTSFTRPFMQAREVVGMEDVTVPGGTFRCAKVQTTLPELALTLRWYDYVSEQGLILRTLRDSLVVIGPSDPSPIDTIEVGERLEVLSIER